MLVVFTAALVNAWLSQSVGVVGEDVASVDSPASEGSAGPRPDAGPQPLVAALDSAAEKSAAVPLSAQTPSEPPDTLEAEETGSSAQSEESIAPAPAEHVPWQRVFEASVESPTFHEVCFDDFDPEKSVPRREDIERWFARVPGHRFSLAETKTRTGYSAVFDGLMRLRMPWREDVALRLSLAKSERLQIHFYHGTEGVTLAYYAANRDRWAAYATTRRPGQAEPRTYALAATDENRAWRTNIRGGGTIELRHAGGEVMLSRGDIVLLRAPMERIPEDVYLDGNAVFNGITAVRTRDFPALHERLSVVFDTDRPADLPWTEHLAEQAEFAKLPDGSIELSSNKAERSSWVITPMPKAGLDEVVVQIDGISPGSGVFLGREDGRPREIVRFVRDRRSGRLCAAVREDERFEGEFKPVRAHVVPFAAPRLWVRLFFACGSLRWWISIDGRNWAMPELPLSYRLGGVSRIGLHCVANSADCHIRLRRVRLRRLPEYSALVDESLVERAPVLADFPNLGAWARASNFHPADVDLGEWRRACAIRTLGVGGRRELDMQLVELLLDDAAERGLPLERQLALLSEAALLLDIRDDHGRLMNLVGRYHALGRTAMKQLGERPYSWIRHELMSVPMATPYDFRVADEDNIRTELIQLSHNERWEEMLDLCRQLRFFRHFERIPLAAWAEATALRNLPRRAGGERIVRRKEEWQHPLIEDLSKDTYNALAELHAVLDSGAVDDAARIIATMDADIFRGVAPFVKDRALLVSLPNAVRMMSDEYPELRAAIVERFGDAANLRVQQAIRDNDDAAIRLATVQFAGTEGAARAHLWLGDRALSNGWATRALSEYREAAEASGIAARGPLALRQALAAAMQGRRLGEPVPADAQFGQLQLTAPEFESLLAELAERTASSAGGDTAGGFEHEALPGPSDFEVHFRSRLDGPVGEKPESELIPRVQQYAVDWVGRQVAVAVENDVMYVSNRFHVAAYDTQNGERKWQSRPPGDKPLRSQDWGLIKMRPLVTRRHVFMRLLYGHGPLLVCLDRANGQTIWTAKAADNVYVVSDPMLVQGHLVVLTLTRQAASESLLRLIVVDQDNGQFLRTQALVSLRESWWRRRCCEVTVLGDGLVVALSGATLCCDLSGDIRWIRRQAVLPPSEEPQWIGQHFQRPTVIDNELYVAQPGMRAVERLDVESGRLVWRAVLPDVQRLIGMSAGRLIVQVAGGLLALDADTGEELWHHQVNDPLDVVLCDDKSTMYAHRRKPEDKKTIRIPQLSWLDSATGELAGAIPLEDLQLEQPFLSPIIAHRGHLWAFSGRDQKEATREIVELIPGGQAE